MDSLQCEIGKRLQTSKHKPLSSKCLCLSLSPSLSLSLSLSLVLFRSLSLSLPPSLSKLMNCPAAGPPDQSHRHFIRRRTSSWTGEQFHSHGFNLGQARAGPLIMGPGSKQPEMGRAQSKAGDAEEEKMRKLDGKVISTQGSRQKRNKQNHKRQDQTEQIDPTRTEQTKPVTETDQR